MFFFSIYFYTLSTYYIIKVKLKYCNIVFFFF